MDAAGDFGFSFAGDHVDFAADAEGISPGEVEAGFYGEAGVGQDEALVVGFEVVEMGSVAVELGAYVVAGAVGEEFCEAGVADEVATGVVGLVAGDGVVGGEGLLDGFDGGVAGVANGGEDELLAVGGGRPTTPVQVMSYQTAVGSLASLPQMSMRTKSPVRMGRELAAVGS